jgi:hypothetical protein
LIGARVIVGAFFFSSWDASIYTILKQTIRHQSFNYCLFNNDLYRCWQDGTAASFGSGQRQSNNTVEHFSIMSDEQQHSLFPLFRPSIVHREAGNQRTRDHEKIFRGIEQQLR